MKLEIEADPSLRSEFMQAKDDNLIERRVISSLELCGGSGGGLEESDGGSGGVGEDGHPTYGGDFQGAFVDGCAEGLGFFGGGVDVFDAYVGQPGGGHAG